MAIETCFHPAPHWRGLCRPGSCGFWAAQPRHTHARLGLRAKSGRAPDNQDTSRWNSPETAAQGASRLDGSHCEILGCSTPSTAGTRAPCPRPNSSSSPAVRSRAATWWEGGQERKHRWGTKPGTDIFGFLKQKFKSRKWEHTKGKKIKSESMDRKIWLTNPPLILHTILYGKKNKTKTQFITTQSKCLQPKIYENISVEIALKKNKNKKGNQQAFDHSFLNKTGRSTLKHTEEYSTQRARNSDLLISTVWTLKMVWSWLPEKGTGDFKLKLS